MFSDTPSSLRERWTTYANSLPKETFVAELPLHVREDVIHNGKSVGLSGYVDIIKDVLRDFPAGVDHIPTLVIDEQYQAVAARVVLVPSDEAKNRGLKPLIEHVFYQYRDDKIKEVWSMVQELPSRG